MMEQQHMHGGLPGREFDLVIKFNADRINGVMRSCGSMLEQWNRLNTETVKFCTARWKEDLEVPSRLMRSQAPGDVTRVCAGFTRKMLDDYGDQTCRVMNFVNTLGREPAAAETDARDDIADVAVPEPVQEAGTQAEPEAAKAQTTDEPAEEQAASETSATPKAKFAAAKGGRPTAKDTA